MDFPPNTTLVGAVASSDVVTQLGVVATPPPQPQSTNKVQPMMVETWRIAVPSLARISRETRRPTQLGRACLSVCVRGESVANRATRRSVPGRSPVRRNELVSVPHKAKRGTGQVGSPFARFASHQDANRVERAMNLLTSWATLRRAPLAHRTARAAG